MSKIAVVLFNLGGPDNLKNVKPFLFNLFNDKAIINLPQPFRYIIAKIISNFRAGKARLNYAKIGNGSPLLSATNSQALALEKVLNKNDNDNSYKVLVCMRYWHPMTEEIIEEIKNGDFEKIILLPLYPQFSVTTSGSSFKKWHEIAKREGVNLPTSEICCYPINKFFINAHVKIIKKTLLEHRESENLSWRILFSAHGLPQNIIDNGDPYQHHVEKTVQEIVKLIDKEYFDYRICYQSKVGPMKWLSPSTEEEILLGAKDNKALLIVPIAFISEHIETLVELDMEYKEFADKSGVKVYIRAPALNVSPDFINGLADLCININLNKNSNCSAAHRCHLQIGTTQTA